MKKRVISLLLTVLLILPLLPVLPIPASAYGMFGSGTEDDPYVITDMEAWNDFADNIRYGVQLDKYYKLSEDFDNSSQPLTESIATNGYPFKGHFDGNGRTLTVSLNNGSFEYLAPFYSIDGATITDLTVTGTIYGAAHSAGLVGYAQGSNVIRGCTISATVETNVYLDDSSVGGVVGDAKNSTILMEDTIFSGEVDNIFQFAGGLIGWCSGDANLTLTNCMFCGTRSIGGDFHPIALKSAEANVSASFDEVYYTRPKNA